MGDILADGSIASCDGIIKFPINIVKRDGQTVDFHLAYVIDRRYS